MSTPVNYLLFVNFATVLNKYMGLCFFSSKGALMLVISGRFTKDNQLLQPFLVSCGVWTVSIVIVG